MADIFWLSARDVYPPSRRAISVLGTPRNLAVFFLTGAIAFQMVGLAGCLISGITALGTVCPLVVIAYVLLRCRALVGAANATDGASAYRDGERHSRAMLFATFVSALAHMVAVRSPTIVFVPAIGTLWTLLNSFYFVACRAVPDKGPTSPDNDDDERFV